MLFNMSMCTGLALYRLQGFATTTACTYKAAHSSQLPPRLTPQTHETAAIFQRVPLPAKCQLAAFVVLFTDWKKFHSRRQYLQQHVLNPSQEDCLQLRYQDSSLDTPKCNGGIRRFASIAKLAGEQLEPYIAGLVPKLYRYQYDPNVRVRDAMSHIWRALVAEPKKTVDQHFIAILTELLKVCLFTSTSNNPARLKIWHVTRNNSILCCITVGCCTASS